MEPMSWELPFMEYIQSSIIKGLCFPLTLWAALCLVLPQNFNETLGHSKRHLMDPVPAAVPKEQGKEVSKEEAKRGVQSLSQSPDQLQTQVLAKVKLSGQMASEVSGCHKELQHFWPREMGDWSLREGEMLALCLCLLYEISSFCSPILSSHLWSLCSLFHSAAAGGKRKKNGREIVQFASAGMFIICTG